MAHTSEFGSQIARSGFLNEELVAQKFNNWASDSDAQFCLKEMGYDLDRIEAVAAETGSVAKKKLKKQGYVFEKGNEKTDVRVQLEIFQKTGSEFQNLSCKLVTKDAYPEKNVYRGFNQVDKRWVDNYNKFWSLPPDVLETFKYFTGELAPYLEKTKDPRRMFLNEMDSQRVQGLLKFLETIKVLIVSDVLKGRGILSSEWILVALVKKDRDLVIDTTWTLKSINEAINYYSYGDVKLSPQGSLQIGRITAQRKGGDGGRKSANMLQFKFDPLELLFPKSNAYQLEGDLDK